MVQINKQGFLSKTARTFFYQCRNEKCLKLFYASRNTDECPKCHCKNLTIICPVLGPPWED